MKIKSSVLIDTITKKEYPLASYVMNRIKDTRDETSISLVIDWPSTQVWKKESERGRVYRLISNRDDNFDEFIQLIGHSGLPNGLSSYFTVVNNLVAMEQTYRHGKKTKEKKKSR